MGNWLRYKSSETERTVTGTQSKVAVKRKERNDRDNDDQCSDLSCASSRKRRRLKSTSEYIYNALFLEGENSDVKLRAFGRDWNLHKVYLRQAGYFGGMFNSSWKESTMKVCL